MRVKKPHSIVYNNVIDAMKCVDGTDSCVANKNAIIEDFTEMEQASSELFVLAEAMIDETS